MSGNQSRILANMTPSLLQLNDTLLTEVFKLVSVTDKSTALQRTCMRFRRLLQNSIARDAWGHVTVRMDDHSDVSTQHVNCLVDLLLSRLPGAECSEIG